MELEEYLAGLGGAERDRAGRLGLRFGIDAVIKRLRYHPVEPLNDLESTLNKENRRVRFQVRGLYESIDVNHSPTGWFITNHLQTEADGTRVLTTEVIGPNGATGIFERAYNPDLQQVEFRSAFLGLRGMPEVPAWVNGSGIPLVPTTGTPTVQYFTLYQLKILKVPAGERRWWRRCLYKLRLRSGPFSGPGTVTSIKLSTVQNAETIVHLHWLKQQHPAADLSDLTSHTASVEYAKVTAVQCGYRVRRVEYKPGKEWERPIGTLLDFFEAGSSSRKAENDKLLARYSLDRMSVMKQNFDIELVVEPA